MQTRRQTNLHNIPIRDLLLDEHKRNPETERKPSKPRLERRREVIKQRIAAEEWTAKLQAAQVKQTELTNLINRSQEPEQKPKKPERVAEVSTTMIEEPVVQSAEETATLRQVVQAQNVLIDAQTRHIENLRNTIDAAKALYDLSTQSIVRRERGNVFMVIDTESFKFNDELLPLQIAWRIFSWNPNTSELLPITTMSTAYVAEVIQNPEYRAVLEDTSPHCLKRHDNNVHDEAGIIMSTQEILNSILQQIQESSVATLVGYNISWDFSAIRNMISTFYPDCSTFDARCDNPFNPMNLDYVDLMHETVKKYGQLLAETGIEDGTIHRAEDSNRIVLRKNTKYSKSIYSAAYVLQTFFGVKQEHMAEHDVEHEALLLQKCLDDYGLESLEYNICYPQTNCYQRMLHWANELFVDPINIGTPPTRQKRRVIASDSSTDEDYVPIRSTTVPRDTTVCLFGDTDTDDAAPPGKDKEEMM